MYMSWSLIEAYDSPEKGWLVYVGLFAVHLFNVCVIFLNGGLQVEVK
jgi:hypothetical protein